MTRILAGLPDEDNKWLDKFAAEQGKSRAAVLSLIVRWYRQNIEGKKMRILTEIPDEDVKELDALASKKKSSRAAAIRDAVKLYLVHNSDNRDWIERGYGYWKGRVDVGDPVEYQRAMREDRTPYEDL